MFNIQTSIKCTFSQYIILAYVKVAKIKNTPSFSLDARKQARLHVAIIKETKIRERFKI